MSEYKFGDVVVIDGLKRIVLKSETHTLTKELYPGQPKIFQYVIAVRPGKRRAFRTFDAVKISRKIGNIIDPDKMFLLEDTA